MDALSVGSNGNRKNRLRNRRRRRRRQEVFIAFLYREFMLTESMKTRPRSPHTKEHLHKGGYVMCDPQ